MDPSSRISDTTEVLLSKLPVGSTNYYLDTLTRTDLQEKDLANFRDVYERLVFTTVLRKTLLTNLIKAIGNVAQVGMFWWKTFTPSLINTKALKIFLELLLVDNTLLNLLVNQFSADCKSFFFTLPLFS